MFPGRFAQLRELRLLLVRQVESLEVPAHPVAGVHLRLRAVFRFGLGERRGDAHAERACQAECQEAASQPIHS